MKKIEKNVDNKKKSVYHNRKKKKKKRGHPHSRQLLELMKEREEEDKGARKMF